MDDTKLLHQIIEQKNEFIETLLEENKRLVKQIEELTKKEDD